MPYLRRRPGPREISWSLAALPGYPRTVISTGHLAGFALLSLALIGTTVGGQIGASLQVAAVAFGIGELVERSVAVFTVIKLAGAAYLAYLGMRAIRDRRSLAAALDVTAERKSNGIILRDGIIVGVSNPKVIVFFVAVLPQFADRAAGLTPGD
jgi:threonine/homoserine/homoserine lactone efflux protein